MAVFHALPRPPHRPGPGRAELGAGPGGAAGSGRASAAVAPPTLPTLQSPAEGGGCKGQNLGLDTGGECAMTIVDWDELRRCVGGNEDRARAVAAQMLEECPRVLEEVRSGLAAGDAKAVGLSAHRLKGSVRHFGARSVMAAAATVERHADAQDLAAAAAAFPALEAEVARFAAALAEGGGRTPAEEGR